MENKTNFRNVYKSNHLGVIDLEEILELGKSLIFTIDRVEQFAGEKKVNVAGKNINANICYFKEDVKPLVLNSTNSFTIKNISKSNHIENWSGIKIKLYIDKNVKMKGEIVGGVRIDPNFKELPTLTKDHASYEAVLKHVSNGGSIEDVKKKFIIPRELEKELKQV